jgi:tetratricopeptide (TPR) repeat protein
MKQVKTLKTLALATLLAVLAPAAWADYQAGMDYFKSGKYVEAAAEFQAIVDQSPEYDFGYYILGMSFLKLDKIPDAEKNLKKALELNPDKFAYHYGLAQALMKRRQYRDVVLTLAEAEGLVTDDANKYRLYSLKGFANASQKRWAEVIEDLEKANAIKKSHNVMVQLGKAYYSLGHNDKALPQFKNALQHNPNDAPTQRLMAEACVKLGRESRNAAEKERHYKTAMAAAEKARSLDPGNFEMVNLVGKAALGAGDYTKAAEAFRQVLKQKPDYCYAMINLGKTYIAQEQWDSAEAPLQNAARCSPREATIYSSLGLVYQKYGKASQEAKDRDKAIEQYDKAKDYYSKAQELKPSSFVSDAIAAINKNVEVIEANKAADAMEAEQAAAIKAEQERVAEEERKRAEWEKKRQQDD